MLSSENRKRLMDLRVVFHKYTTKTYTGDYEKRDEFDDTYKANSKMEIPSYDEMKKQIFDRLTVDGYKFVVCSPKKANCIIRIFRKENVVDKNLGGLCGAVCFVKGPFGSWKRTEENGQYELEITYDNTFKVTYYTSLFTQYHQDVDADYYDVYIRVLDI